MTNLKQIFEPSKADLAFEEFRQIFASTQCHVLDEGRMMNYSVPNLSTAVDNLKRAQEIISQQKLPLTAQVFSHYSDHVLHITFKSNQS